MSPERSVSPRGRFRIAAGLLAGQSGSLLDIGARDAGLEKLLEPTSFRYESADLGGERHDHRVDLERPLPFAEVAYDWVVALDVLEHVDRIHEALAELLRVARQGCVLSLPNSASWPHRARFLLVGRLSTDKYDLPPRPVRDRHRWLVHLGDADRFVAAAAACAGFEVDRRVVECEGRRPAARAIAWTLLRTGLPLDSLLGSRAVYRLVRRRSAGGP